MARRIRTGNSMTRIEGFNEIRELLETVRNRVPSRYEEILETVSTKIKVDAESKINSKTGELKGSLRKKKKSQSGVTSYEISAGGQSAPHAHLVEFGHRQVTKTGEVIGDVPARPFLRTAFEDNKDELIVMITRIIDQAIRG